MTTIGNALFGATRRAVLAFLFGHPDQRFYQRQIIHTLGLGSGAIQRELEQLSYAGILTRTVEGRQVYFQANQRCPVFEDLRGLVQKTFGLAQVLTDALQPIADGIRLAFIYGSIAAGSETSDSDLDVMVIVDDVSLSDVVSTLTEAQRRLRRDINPSVYPAREFRRKLAQGQHFVSSVVRGPKIFVIGDERELTRLAQIRMGKGSQNKPSGDG